VSHHHPDWYIRIHLGIALSAHFLKENGMLLGSVQSEALFAVTISGMVNTVICPDMIDYSAIFGSQALIYLHSPIQLVYLFQHYCMLITSLLSVVLE
jgi:hypothetical protein